MADTVPGQLHDVPTVTLPQGTVVDVAAMLAQRGHDIAFLPYVARILIENLIRSRACNEADTDTVEAALDWPNMPAGSALPLGVTRVVMPDSSGVPVLADLAALRDTVAQDGGDPATVRFAVPAHLIVDHSLQVDHRGSADAGEKNLAREFERNHERYRFLKWTRLAFDQIEIVPPGGGIIHQINLERLASVVAIDTRFDTPLIAPELVIGTDSHTPMVNGAGVLGWGVGGIEAETVLLGQPLVIAKPRVVGVKLMGALGPAVLATDLALSLAHFLRDAGVVAAFIEFHGEGVATLPVPDRATVANMTPEYGASVGYFPIDNETLTFLRATGRTREQVAAVEAVARALHIYREPGDGPPVYDRDLEFDLGSVEPVMAGPKRPEQRVPLSALRENFQQALTRAPAAGGFGIVPDQLERVAACTVSGQEVRLRHGSVVIAAITSCTNTANPAAMIAAGLIARNALARGLKPASWVKTSFAPGSQTVPDYLARMGLMAPLEALGFGVVGYGCTTCGGKSGPLDAAIARAIEEGSLVAAAVLSGNRNFEGRIHRLVRAAYLGAPHLVVAYALAGRIDIDLGTESLGYDREGRPVYYADIAPDPGELALLARAALEPEAYARVYAAMYAGPQAWQALPAPTGLRFAWDPQSTYLVRPPFFDLAAAPMGDRIAGARVLCLLGDSVNTDHISPGGEIPADSAAGTYLQSLGILPANFNTYVGRRGNAEVMRRATFAHVRFRNLLTPEREGGYTRLFPEQAIVQIHEAADAYVERAVPLIVIAGENYGTGSSRDWAAKGPMLLGVRAVLASSFERIHRSNLIGMGILPLTIVSPGGWHALRLDGTETYDIDGLAAALADAATGTAVCVTAQAQDGRMIVFEAQVDASTAAERRQLRHGGIFRLAREKTRRVEDNAQEATKRAATATSKDS